MTGADALLAIALAAAIVASLNAYVLFAGADFGGGVWDLFATGPRRVEQRSLIAHAIGPIWEANHVWLILVVVLLFTCFPTVFARLATVLHIPLSLMLIGIVLRGSAFAFRAYGREDDDARWRWGRVFAIASFFTPALLGMSLGALVSGNIAVPEAIPSAFVPVFITPWLTPFALGTGVMAMSACAMLAAVYLCVEAQDKALRDDFRRRALAAVGVLSVAAVATLMTAFRHAPRIGHGLTTLTIALPIAVTTMLAALLTIVTVVRRAFIAARIAAAALVSLLLWGWASASYPYLIPGQTTITDAAAPPATLRAVAVALVVGGIVLAPSLVFLFRLFKSRDAALGDSHG